MREKFAQAAIGRIVSIGRDRRLQFIDHIQQLSTRSEHEMAWTRTGMGFGDERVLSEGSFGGVKRISEQLIEPEISDQGETVIGRQSDGVGMRSLLPFLVRAARAPVLHEGGSFAQSAIP